VVVCKWPGREYGPGGKTVFLTNASVDKPLQPFDDDDDRSLIENCGIKAATPQWDLGHPPQKTERAVQVHVVFALLLGGRLKDRPPSVGTHQRVFAKYGISARG
jgi:hypothetical protein